jgi:hypothetical protein
MLAREPFSLRDQPAPKDVQAHEFVHSARRQRDSKRAAEWMDKPPVDFRSGLPIDWHIDLLTPQALSGLRRLVLRRQTDGGRRPQAHAVRRGFGLMSAPRGIALPVADPR